MENKMHLSPEISMKLLLFEEKMVSDSNWVVNGMDQSVHLEEA